MNSVGCWTRDIWAGDVRCILGYDDVREKVAVVMMIICGYARVRYFKNE